MTTRRHPHLPPVWLMALALVAVAANLRTAMASVPPLTETIADDLGLSNTALGALTTLPVLCMGLFAPTAQRIAARLGAAASVELSIVCVALGLGLRLAGGATWPLYAGTFVAGVGIAIGGTLLPGLVKELFPPERAGLVTGPLHAGDDGRGRRVLGAVGAAQGLARVVAGLARFVVAAGGRRVCSPGCRCCVGTPGTAPRTRRSARTTRLPWKHATAWLVAGYLAVQSVEFYSTLAWLAPSYTARGWDPTHAGYLLSVFTAAQLVSGLLAPALTDRIHDRRVLLLSASVLGLLGQAGLWLAPHGAPWVWATVLGLRAGRVVRARPGPDGRLRRARQRPARGWPGWRSCSATRSRRSGRPAWAPCATSPVGSPRSGER